MYKNDTVVRGIKSTGASLAYLNVTGTPLASVTGTANVKGNWRLTVENLLKAGTAVYRVVITGTSHAQTMAKTNAVNTTLIPGLTITFGTLAAGDQANIYFSDEYVVNT